MGNLFMTTYGNDLNRSHALNFGCFILLFFLVVFTLDGQAQELNSAQRERIVEANIPVPEIDAKAWVLMEFNSGWVVAGKNTREKLSPASITKLMMNYVIFEKLSAGEIDFTDQVSISKKAWKVEGSRMFADVNTQIELKHLLKSSVIQSGNDAAIALAEYVAGSELGFAQLMNSAASRLGLLDSNFTNSTGLTAPGHHMSASDIAALSAAIIRNFPDFYPWYAEKEYSHNNIQQFNRNKLLWKDSSVDGLKTGFTEDAGYCLVGSAQRNDQRWIAVVLGAKGEREREAAVLQLLNYAFAAYQPMRLLDKQGGLVSAKVYGGEVDEVRLQAIQATNIVVPVGRETDVVTELKYSPYFEAPISAGQPMGIASLSLEGQNIIDVKLIATSTIKEGSWWKRMLDSIALRFK